MQFYRLCSQSLMTSEIQISHSLVSFPRVLVYSLQVSKSLTMMTRIAVILALLVCIAMGQNHNSPLGASYECVKDAFVCGDEAERCISNDHVCDGYYDCQNGKDEENCAKMKPMSDVLHADDLNPEIPTFGLEMGPVKDIPSHNR